MLRSESPLSNNPISFRIIGHAWFAVLLIYSIVYVAERFCYVDSAWQFFQRINGNGFIFPSGRYGVIFSELPVFIALKCNASFTFLAYLFSASYILLYYGIWLLCTSVLKNATAGIAIVFCTFMGVREGFLHPVTETQQCLMYSVLLYALLTYSNPRNSLVAVMVLLTVLTIIFTHPVGIFTGGFAALLVMVESRNYRNHFAWVSLVIMVAITLWRFFFPTDNYDAAFYDQLKGNGVSENSSGNGALNFLFIHFVNFYWVPVVAMVVMWIWLVIRRSWKILVFSIAGVAGYTFIAAYTYSNGDSSILMERAFLPACFMISLVFAGLLAQTRFSRKWVPTLFILFFLVNGLRYINNGCLMFKKRTAYLNSLIVRAQQTVSDKLYITPTKEDLDNINVPWALGTETMMYSKFKYGKEVSITFIDEICDPLSVRLTSFYCMPVDSLNKSYFNLSTDPYQPLP